MKNRLRALLAVGIFVVAVSGLTGCKLTFTPSEDVEESRSDEDDEDDDNRDRDDDEDRDRDERDDEDRDERDDDEDRNDGRDDRDDEEQDDDDDVSEYNSDDYGFASTEDLITNYFQALADCDEDAIKRCIPGMNFSDSHYEEIAEEQYEYAVSLSSQAELLVDEMEIFTEPYDADDLDAELYENIIERLGASELEVSTIRLPYEVKQTGERVVEEVDGCITICVDGKWYLGGLAEEDPEVITESYGNDDYDNEQSDSDYLYTDGDWCGIVIEEDRMIVTYLDGINDGYPIGDEATFDSLCDNLSRVTSEFDRETYRKVLSLYFGNSEYFENLYSVDTETQAVVLGRLAEVSQSIYNINGAVNGMVVYATDQSDYVYNVYCNDYGYCKLHYNDSTLELTLVQDSTGDEMQGELSDEAVLLWAEAALEALNGE